MLGVLGGALGLLLALWANQLLVSYLKTTPLAAINLELDYRVLIFTAVVSVTTGIVFGRRSLKMENLWQDLRYGCMLRKTPGFTAVAVLALALGIGANTFIFSVVNALLLNPLSFPESGKITSMLVRDPDSGAIYSSYSFPNFEDIRNQNRSFEQVAALYSTTQFLTSGDEPERLRGVFVSSELFPLLRIQPLLGRSFTADEERVKGGKFLVISHDLWQRRFNGDPEVVGQELRLDNQPAIVLGVMPPGFKFPVGAKQADFWMPLISSIPQGARGARGAVYLGLFGRLRADVSLDQAQAEMDMIARRLAEQYPNENTGLNIALVATHERLVGNWRRALLILMGAVGRARGLNGTFTAR